MRTSVLGRRRGRGQENVRKITGCVKPRGESQSEMVTCEIVTIGNERQLNLQRVSAVSSLHKRHCTDETPATRMAEFAK